MFLRSVDDVCHDQQKHAADLLGHEAHIEQPSLLESFALACLRPLLHCCSEQVLGCRI